MGEPAPPAAATRVDGDLLAEAFGDVVDRSNFGFVWADTDLVATHRFGPLVDFVALGQDLTFSVLPLFGLQDQIKSLRRKPQHVIDIPNVAIVVDEGPTPRLNLQVSWLPRRRAYLLAVSRVMSTSELEIELTRQTRARQIVEAQLVENSKAIERANVELTRANRDLAEFAYVISHDLRAPMRAMRYFAEDLDGALAANDQEAASEQLARIHAQSRRMSQMLTDLLAYSKIGRKEEAVEVVDTGALIHSVVASLPRPVATRVEISGHWPTVETSAAPLDLVLRNIVENAIKHSANDSARIDVSCTAEKRCLKLNITDDGPGIAPEYHEAIFKPFQRLDGAETIDGSGIGLALVRKTVESCGATLTLSSDPASRPGTAFTISWPCRILT